jgi:hypothetical protein
MVIYFHQFTSEIGMPDIPAAMLGGETGRWEI